MRRENHLVKECQQMCEHQNETGGFGGLPSSPKLKAKKMAPLDEPVAYMAVATFCTHARAAKSLKNGAQPIKRNAMP